MKIYDTMISVDEFNQQFETTYPSNRDRVKYKILD